MYGEGFGLVSLGSPVEYWYAANDGSVTLVKAFQTQIEGIMLVNGAYPAILGQDLFAWEERAINSALGKLAQQHQTISVAIANLKDRLKKIEEGWQSGKAEGREVREGLDTSQ